MSKFQPSTRICRTAVAVAAVAACAQAVCAECGLDEPTWPVLTPEYLDRPLNPGEWDWALDGFDAMPEFAVAKEARYGAHFTRDGKPFFPLWGWVIASHRPDRRPTLGDIELDFQTMFTRQHKWWPRGTEINVEVFERLAEESFRANTNAYFLLEIDLYPPDDFVAKHPGEMCRMEDGSISRDNANGNNYSFSSAFAASQMENVLVRVINYVEHRPWARRIAGYRINSGTTVEWLHWYRSGGALDFSEPAKRGFAKFCRERYPELKDVSVPSGAERKARDGDDIVWNAKDHIRAIAWQEYVSEVVSGMLIRMCSAAKAKLAALGRKKLVGTYYGYVVNAPGYGDRQRYGHYAVKKVLDSGAVDFLMSPPEYSTRTPGQAHVDMKPYATLKANGIVSVVEHDLRTAHSSHLKPPASVCNQAPTHALSLAYIRRNLGVSLCRNEPLSIFDIFSGVAYDFPESRRDIAAMRTVGKWCLEKKCPRTAEIAIVMSERTVTTLGECDRAPSCMAPLEPFQQYDTDGTPRVTRLSAPVPWYDTHLWNQSRFGRIGAPVDCLLAEDLADHPGNYRFYIFPNAWRYDAKLAAAAARLRSHGCTLLWFYAPGYVSVDGNGTDGMASLTGMRFGRIPGKVAAELKMSDGRKMGVAGNAFEPLFRCVSEGAEILGRYANGDAGAGAVKTGEATSVFCGTWRPDVKFLAEIARSAGVHLFSDTDDAVEANDRLVSLHARRAGTKTIRLPRRTDVVDVFARKVVARNVDSFSFDAALHSSHLFYYGEDAESLLRKIGEAR